jgi:integrase
LTNFDILSQEEEEDEETRTKSQKIAHDPSGLLRKHRRIFLVTEGHRSKKTEDKYRVSFQHFLDYIRISDLDVLLDLGRNAIQELVIKYVLSLRDNPDKKYSCSTVNVYCAAILYFFDNNDIELNRRIIRRYYPSDESTLYDDDRPYFREEIQQIIRSGIDLRTKAMILLMASTGVRIGALHSMQIGDLTPAISYKYCF